MPLRRFLRESARMAEITSGSTTVLIIGTTEGIDVGDSIRGPGIPVGATVTVVTTNVSVTISAAATATNNAQVLLSGQLVNPGNTAVKTFPSVPVDGNENARALSLELELTTVGGAPAFTFKYQGSEDGSDVADASSDWFDLTVTKPDDTVTVAPTVTIAVGVTEFSVDLSKHPVRKVRFVCLTDTNVTYEGDVYGEVMVSE